VGSLFDTVYICMQDWTTLCEIALQGHWRSCIWRSLLFYPRYPV